MKDTIIQILRLAQEGKAQILAKGVNKSFKCKRNCDDYIINWFCRNITSAHYFAYSTRFIEAIVCSISYFNCPKYMIAFSVG